MRLFFWIESSKIYWDTRIIALKYVILLQCRYQQPNQKWVETYHRFSRRVIFPPFSWLSHESSGWKLQPTFCCLLNFHREFVCVIRSSIQVQWIVDCRHPQFSQRKVFVVSRRRYSLFFDAVASWNDAYSHYKFYRFLRYQNVTRIFPIDIRSLEFKQWYLDWLRAHLGNPQCVESLQVWLVKAPDFF